LDKDDISLIEIGPRFCLTPIRIFEGSFGGPTVFENPEFVHPNFVRASLRKGKSEKYNKRQQAINERQNRVTLAEESTETETSNKRVFE
jgi:ribosome biogenesis protein BRX1